MTPEELQAYRQGVRREIEEEFRRMSPEERAQISAGIRRLREEHRTKNQELEATETGNALSEQASELRRGQ